jgi:hemolysin III
MAGIVSRSIWLFFLQLFTFSTLYHGIQHTQAKHTLEILDHISIYFLIAGTYTCFTYVYAKFFWHYVAIGLWGHRIRNNLYDFF